MRSWRDFLHEQALDHHYPQRFTTAPGINGVLNALADDLAGFQNGVVKDADVLTALANLSGTNPKTVATILRGFFAL